MSNASDYDLLRLMHRGDQAAARELWSRLGGRLTALASAMLRNTGGASLGPDVVQGVLLRVLKLPTREISAVRDAAAWLTTLVRREAIDARRRLARTSGRESTGGAGIDAGRGPVGSEADLLAAMDGLDDHERELIQLKHVAGLTFDQIGLVLSENRDTLASRYRVALGRLRGMVAEREGAVRAGAGRS